MKTAHNVATPLGCAQGIEGLDSLSTIESTQQRLWILALLLFSLVTLSLLTMDATTATEWLFGNMNSDTRAFVEYYGTSLALFLILLLVCGYFSEKLLCIRAKNRELICKLETTARTLALRNHQLDTWDQLSHQLITNFNLPRLLELIARTAAEVTESECAAVLLGDSDQPHLRLAAIHERGLQTDLARRVAARVIGKRAALRLSPNSLPEELDRPDLPWEDMVGIAATPLSVSETVRGALLVGRCTPASDYHESVVPVLASFANQASIALEKAELYGQNQRQLQRLTRLLSQLSIVRDGASDTEEDAHTAETRTDCPTVEVSN
ncbi:MAG: GAF domain-containing protein [Armatimonadetes bacterium]|nr:GAF domain-containing protein [Armatimonadota bacterium]